LYQQNVANLEQSYKKFIGYGNARCNRNQMPRAPVSLYNACRHCAIISQRLQFLPAWCFNSQLGKVQTS